MQNTTATAFPFHYFIRKFHAICGIVPLFLFLFLMLTHLSVLLFGSKEMIQGFIACQQTPFFILFDSVFIILPLLFHFSYSMLLLYHGRINIHQYSNISNWRYVLQTMAGLAGLVFVFYHIGQLITVYFGHMSGYHYIQTILFAHKGIETIIVFWICLFLMTYYFFNGFWTFLIDFGVTTNRLSQKASSFFWSGLFVLVVAFEVFLLIMSVVKDVVV